MMAQVANESELETALNSGEALIELTASFLITTSHNINTTTTLTSAEGGPYVLTKDANFSAYIFGVFNGITVTFNDIILDGAKQAHSSTSEDQSLILVDHGSLILDNGVILQNNKAIYGGGVHMNSNTDNSLTMRGTAIIQNNEVTTQGGAIYAMDSIVDISGEAHIEQNTSNRYAGGIYFSHSAEYPLTIHGNALITKNNADEAGGGIAIAKGACTIYDQVTISYNNATFGGGIKFNGTDISIAESVTINNNTSSQGGGIHASPPVNSGVISIHGKFINNSSRSGGGIALTLDISTQEIDFTNAQFINNTALDSSGGGILFSGTTFTGSLMTIQLGHTVFENNTAYVDGSAIYFYYRVVRSFNIQCEHMRFTNNTANTRNGSFYLRKQGITNLTMEQCIFQKNTAVNGGVLYIEALDNSQFTITSLDDTFTENTATNNGGAICLTQGAINAQFDHVMMTGNLATNDGGAIVITESTGDITFDGNSELRGNSAGHGGGIYESGTSRLSFLNSTTTNNIASAYGAGIVSDSPLFLGGNIHILDGLYIPTEYTIPTISQSLSSTSTIQLESTPYIISNPEGTPILLATSDLTLTDSDANAFLIPASDLAGWTSQLDGPSQIVLTPIIYSIRYENTMGLPNPNPIFYTVVSDTITLLPLTTLDYLFFGWFDAAQGGTNITEIPKGSTQDLTLYARLELIPPTYHLVHFDANTLDHMTQYLPLDQEVLENESLTISSLVPTQEHMTFLHWNTAPNDTGTIYQPSEPTQPITTNLTLYAIWKAA